VLAGIGTVYTPAGTTVTCNAAQRFTPLPPLPVSMPTPTGMLIGTDAW
jgi:hypothetical protein